MLLNSIRFDVLAESESKHLFTLDIQRRYTKGRQERRGAYYLCRAISSQPVEKMKYDDLNPVHIAFILTDYKEKTSSIRKVGLCYRDTGELYDDLIELILVYVPSIIKDAMEHVNNDLYVFFRFFSINSVKDAEVFVNDFESNDLGMELIKMYNKIVASPEQLQEIENSPYYTQRLTEAQLEEAREETRVKTRVEAVNKMVDLLKEGYDIETAQKMVLGEAK